ncbi:alcohol dehydrogenase [Eggerthellaceae bacterium zg-887]|uniref:alcohol dehydrogenase n=1 Tax=Xiamenia xianingshaonis TaxID=2682776 RepID=UPI00140ACCD8|nr:alcohol dehydrogenase [Xiamenia xianingshaonis]NHM15609.1 alcohol dehydrogenase [Xiamenia xianingshaonis]
MATARREKIALCIFALLILGSLGGLLWYLVAGHSWNVAATNIDDTFGSMAGYNVVLYEGSEELDEKRHQKASLKTPEKESGAVKDEKPSATSAAKASALPLTIESVEESYEEKGASAFALDIKDPLLYQEGTILRRGDKRFGVISVETVADRPDLREAVKEFEAAAVDMVIAIAPKKGLVKGVEGVDVAICTEELDLLAMGKTIGATLYVAPPEHGSVGAILVSPSNVVSAKVITEL